MKLVLEQVEKVALAQAEDQVEEVALFQVEEQMEEVALAQEQSQTGTFVQQTSHARRARVTATLIMSAGLD